MFGKEALSIKRSGAIRGFLGWQRLLAASSPAMSHIPCHHRSPFPGCWRSGRFTNLCGQPSFRRSGFQGTRRKELVFDEFSKCRPIQCDRGRTYPARSSTCFGIRAQLMELRGIFRASSGIHTSARRQGRYICASAQEEGGLGDEKCWAEFDRDLDAASDGPRCDNTEDLGETEGSATDISVVNFYHFVEMSDPHGEVSRHAAFLQGRDIRGRIYISHQGINAQLSGAAPEAMEYADWVRADARFSNMLVQISRSPGGHAFPRLRLRFKPSLVQVEGGTLNLPITDPSARAMQLTPREWTERLDTASSSDMQESLGNGSARRPYVLLDVRNGYEWDLGHFPMAQRPDVDCFKSTEFGLTVNKPLSSDPLADVDKEAVDVMMYCTGGIRCDVFSTILRQRGFRNLYTLKGGVSNYLKEEGPRKWAGSLFVFDSRLAVPSYVYHQAQAGEQASSLECDTRDKLYSYSSSVAQICATCRLCGDLIPEARHHNCANLDCNVLYLCCEDCLVQQRGCCSQSCSLSSRLRPILTDQQYARWHIYRPKVPASPKPRGYLSGRALRRRERKEQRQGVQSDTTALEVTLNVN